MHLSIPMSDTMEYIDQTEISPLISHANVKVCYVGQQPNRNRTVITKEVAIEMGRKLPGSPIVGLFNKETKDFEEHNREIIVEGGQYQLIDVTKPYGFVPLNAQVWFEKFIDDGVEHEYLCTECYIWTGAYPESKRILEQGNNQSMELSTEFQKGFWTNDANTGNRIFIYNEALIEKLCILGENIEPCFEGAQIKSQFSLENSPEFQEFKTKMFSMITELQNTLNKGGSPMENEFKKKEDQEQEDTKKEESNGTPANKQEEKKPEDDKKKKYNLDEITEYQELLGRYNELQNQYTNLMNVKSALDVEVASLKEFKLTAERQAKQAMIDSFAMLNDEDKKDVITNIDSYSLDDIEAKLAVICVRNRVNFSNLDSHKQEEKKPEDNPKGLFSLDGSGVDNVPAWIKAVRDFSTASK